MSRMTDIISKRPEDVTDAEYDALVDALKTAMKLVEVLQRKYQQLTGKRLVKEVAPWQTPNL